MLGALLEEHPCSPALPRIRAGRAELERVKSILEGGEGGGREGGEKQLFWETNTPGVSLA